jgi:hypothetical protein
MATGRRHRRPQDPIRRNPARQRNLDHPLRHRNHPRPRRTMTPCESQNTQVRHADASRRCRHPAPSPICSQAASAARRRSLRQGPHFPPAVRPASGQTELRQPGHTHPAASIRRHCSSTHAGRARVWPPAPYSGPPRAPSRHGSLGVVHRAHPALSALRGAKTSRAVQPVCHGRASVVFRRSYGGARTRGSATQTAVLVQPANNDRTGRKPWDRQRYWRRNR